MRPPSLLLAGFCGLFAPLLSAGDATAGRVSSNFGQIPIYFEKNIGQAGRDSLFLARGGHFSLDLKRDGAVLFLGKRRITLQTVGASADAALTGEQLLPGRSNYYLGPDRVRWVENVPQFARVHVHDLYAGVDMEWHGNLQRPEFDFLLRPGADPASIGLRFPDADSVSVDRRGDLSIRAGDAELREEAPVAWQEIRGRRVAREVKYKLIGAREVRLSIDGYDRSAPLTIDPVIVYSTFVHGSQEDFVNAIAVDRQGDAVIVGDTVSFDFPGTSGFGGHYIVKLNPEGTGLIYATYFGQIGDFGDQTNGVSVDGSGNAYVAGSTVETMPVTTGAYKSTRTENEFSTGFVLEFGATGNLIYGTYLGGTAGDSVNAIAVDTLGNAYVAGETTSTDFPVTTSGACSANQDAFIAILNASGTALLKSACLGGSSADSANALAIDSNADIFIAGNTASKDLPATTGTFQNALNGTENGFVAKLSSDLTISWLTYLGGSASDTVSRLALDSAGNVTVAGYYTSSDFPTTPNSYQAPSSPDCGFSSFVTRLNPAGTALVFSGLFGSVGGIVLDPASSITYIGGSSVTYQVIGGSCALFQMPTTPGAFQGPEVPSYNLDSDAWLGELSADGSTLTYSGTIGGSDSDSVSAIARGADGSLYLAGGTSSGDFPITPGAYQSSATLQYYRPSVSVTKVDMNSSVQCTLTFSPPIVELPSTGGSASVSIDIPNGCPWDLTRFNGAWPTYTTPLEGVGPGTVSFTSDLTTGSDGPSDTLTAYSKELFISQDAQPPNACPAPVVSPTALSFNASGQGQQTINVTITSGCDPSLVTSDGWINAAWQNGPGPIFVTLAPNSFAARQGTVTVGGVAVSVSQAAGSCTATVTGPSSTIPAAGGIAAIQITTSNLMCQWAVYNMTTPWIGPVTQSNPVFIPEPINGVASALVALVVAPNQTASSRSATISAAGQTVSITQDAGPIGTPGLASQGFTVAGGGTSDPGDGGPAVAAAVLDPQDLGWYGGTLYIVDGHHHTIRSVTSDGLIHTVAGGGSGTTSGPATGIALTAPEAIAFSSGGVMYIADQGANLIWQVGTDGTASIFAGGGTDTSDGVSPTNAQLSQPSGVAVSASGDVYISDSDNHRVRKVSQSIITTTAGTGVCGFSGDGGTASTALLCQPSGLAVDASGNLYIADTLNQRVRKFASDGIISTAVGGGSVTQLPAPAQSVKLTEPWQLAFDPTGNLYIADMVSGALLDTAGTVSGLGSRFPSTGVAVDSTGDVFTAGAGTVQKDLPTYSFCSLGTPGASPSNPWPSNRATDVAIWPLLSWTAVTGATSYDVNFGTSNPPPASSGSASPSCNNVTAPAPNYNTTYYWQVVAHTASGAVSSPVWSFTTEQTKVQLSISASEGTVTANPPSADGTYLAGTTVCLNVTSNPGWYFTAWNDDNFNAVLPYCIQLLKNTGVAASFTQQAVPLTLTVQPAGSGSIVANPPPTNGLYGEGTYVLVTAVPNPGWRFVSWSSGSTAATTYVLAFVGGASATATFARSVPGDFDGNGVPDLVWQSISTSEATVHYYGGAQGGVDEGLNWLYPNPVQGWSIVAIADFNRDGHPDAVWQNTTTGQATVHYLTGAQGDIDEGFNWIVANSVSGWSIVGVGDFNQDGIPDVVWQNTTTGQATVHYMGGAQGNVDQGFNWLMAHSVPGWSIVGVAEFNGDGIPDVVWQNHSTRQVTVHYMGGAEGNIDQGFRWLRMDLVPGWHVAGVVDLNGDGHPDLIWQNDTTGQATVHYYAGPQGDVEQSWDWLNVNRVPDWRVIVP